MAMLLDLPLEILRLIISWLPLRSTHHLGATCRHLHRLIHQDDSLWRVRAKRELKLLSISGDLQGGVEDHDWTCRDYNGIIRDPTLQGSKEVFVMYSSEFKSVLRSQREHGSRGELEKLLRSFMPRMLLSSSNKYLDTGFSPKFALFGPGIESPNTKHLVHKIVNSHTSLFDALNFVSGLPGGFGSGVKIDFRKTYTFDLTCLYTNSAKVREYQRGVQRFLTANNRLLRQDVMPSSEPKIDGSGNVLHENVIKLLPTLDAILFAIDGTELDLMDDQESQKEQIMFLKNELSLMTNALVKQEIPILVLFCQWSNSGQTHNRERRIPLQRLAETLNLTSLSSRASWPWAIFDVEIANMQGMAKALDWLLYHVHKKRSNLEYHQQNNKTGRQFTLL